MFKFANFVKRHFLVVTLVIAAALTIGWYGFRLGTAFYIVNETFNVSLARDAKTGEYLGEVISQARDNRNDKVVSYKIKRNDGSIIERPVSEVIIFEP